MRLTFNDIYLWLDFKMKYKIDVLSNALKMIRTDTEATSTIMMSVLLN